MEIKPFAVNTTYFTTEAFPEVIGFCTKDPHTHVQANGEESFEYKLQGKKMYVLKRMGDKWQIVGFLGEQILRVSTGQSLGQVLTQALTFTRSEKDKQETRVNILIPVEKKNLEKALALMYYLGGYPVNFLPVTPEYQLIIERYVKDDLTFLSYSYVPVEFIPWLNEEFKKAGIIGQQKTRTILMYKK